jgi:hypothetical protein
LIKALLNNELIYAQPKLKAYCPHCNCKVKAKCGSQNTWHWAHVNLINCDEWWEPEGEWHFNWKKELGLKNAEVKIEKEGFFHVADFITDSNVIIELQNSQISLKTIEEREKFYGEKMFWLINAEKFKYNFLIDDNSFENGEPLPFNVWYDENKNHWLVDFNNLELSLDDKYWMHCHFFNFNSSIKLWYLINFYEWKDDLTIKIKKINNQLGLKSPDKLKYFKWKKSRKTWLNAKRHLFFDLGDNNIFLIKNWHNGNMGVGMYFSKTEFLSKYAVRQV